MAVKPLTLRAVNPNPGMRSSYRKTLYAQIRAMHNDFLSRLDGLYGSMESRIVGDAKWRSPMERLNEALEALVSKWTARFATLASTFAPRFVKGVFSRVKSTRRQALKDAGFSITMNKSRLMDDRVQALIQMNADAIEGIPATYSSRAAKLVSSSVAAGLDRAALVDGLVKGFGMEVRKAKNIARDQVNKATQVLSQVADEELGFKEGIWKHIPGRKSSRPTHVAMDGKRFKLGEGLYDSEVKRNVKPGELWLCACRYRPVIPETWKVD